MFGKKEMKERVAKLEGEMRKLDEKFYSLGDKIKLLENPPKFKVNDVVVVRDDMTKDKKIVVTPPDTKVFHEFAREYDADFGVGLFLRAPDVIHTYNLISLATKEASREQEDNLVRVSDDKTKKNR